MITECPHCFGRVLPMTDGSCPSCGKNTVDKTELSSTMTSIVVDKGESFPASCALCAQATSRTTKLSFTAKRRPDAGGDLAMSMISPLAGAIVAAFRVNTYNVAVRLPVCDRCKRQKIEPLHVDYENYTMTLLVHRKFAEELMSHRTGT
jgi:hypothetical protein